MWSEKNQEKTKIRSNRKLFSCHTAVSFILLLLLHLFLFLASSKSRKFTSIFSVMYRTRHWIWPLTNIVIDDLLNEKRERKSHNFYCSLFKSLCFVEVHKIHSATQTLIRIHSWNDTYIPPTCLHVHVCMNANASIHNTHVYYFHTNRILIMSQANKYTSF